MNTTRSKFSDNLRIIWAIAAKDIVDALKNKAILSTILSALFLMVFYKVVPALSNGADPPELAVYDAGNSSLMAQLESSDQFHMQEMASQQEMEHHLGLQSSQVLGLTLPPDFDLIAETGVQLELDGYMDHWVSDDQVSEMRSFFEEQLADLVGKPVRIVVESDTIYTRLEGWHPYMASLALTMILVAFGLAITPHLMLEEKRTKTLDALLVSPATAGQVILGKATAGLFYCLVGAGVVLVFNAALIIHWQVAIVAAICGSLFALASGLLLGSLIEVRQQINTWMIILIQPLLIPAVLPSGLLPDKIEKVLSMIPTVTLARTARLACVDSVSLAQFGLPLAYVLGCAALVLASVAWRVRRSDH